LRFIFFSVVAGRSRAMGEREREIRGTGEGEEFHICGEGRKGRKRSRSRRVRHRRTDLRFCWANEINTSAPWGDPRVPSVLPRRRDDATCLTWKNGSRGMISSRGTRLVSAHLRSATFLSRARTLNARSSSRIQLG